MTCTFDNDCTLWVAIFPSWHVLIQILAPWSIQGLYATAQQKYEMFINDLYAHCCVKPPKLTCTC